MKSVMHIGENGKMGQAALKGGGKHKFITASRSGDGCDFKVDITNEDSIRSLFKSVGTFDAVVNTVGFCEYANFVDMTEQQWMTSVMSTMMVQMNLVRIGLEYISDAGSITLVTGFLNSKPIPMAIADATTSGAIESFVKCVAYQLAQRYSYQCNQSDRSGRSMGRLWRDDAWIPTGSRELSWQSL